MNLWLNKLKRIQALAQNGLAYAENPYDIERYEELRQISVELMAALSETDFNTVKDLFAGETGYQTPKVDVRAVIFQEGRLLLIREKVDGCWSLPGGWADIGYSPGEVAAKEVQEEAGLEVEPVRLIGVLDKQKHPHPPSPYYTYKIFIGCRILRGTGQPGMETCGVGFFGPDELPPLSTERITASQIRWLFEDHRQNRVTAVFD